ncbi:MAG: metallophosphoesterase [Myxococcales bacterium]|nr:metallophosphoesterase [Myxococcales bacterium]
MKLWAVSDLHVRHPENRRVVEALEPHPEDWLILGGDIGETVSDLSGVLDLLGPRFAKLLWVPGNHELWTLEGKESLRGVAKYDALVGACRARGVLTPEDPYPIFEHEGGRHLVAPLFTLYDYTFAPAGMGPHQARAWALEDGLICVDEQVLHPDPYPSREAWCRARCEETEARLVAATAEAGCPTVLVNHFPIREELALLPAIPRFKIWCGTQLTRDWPARFAASVVVYGHLHIRRPRWLDGVRYEEVSLGYPRQWQRFAGKASLLRQILPEPVTTR